MTEEFINDIPQRWLFLQLEVHTEHRIIRAQNLVQLPFIAQLGRLQSRKGKDLPKVTELKASNVGSSLGFYFSFLHFLNLY